MSDDATNHCTGGCSDRAAARKDSTADGTDSGANGSVLFLCRHAGTTTQAQQHACNNCTNRKSLYRFHGMTSLSNVEFRVVLAWSCATQDLPKFFFA
jgi:hypothetical protein